MNHLYMTTVKKHTGRLVTWMTLALALVWVAPAAANSLNSIDIASLPDGDLKITLSLDEPLQGDLSSFTTDNPARIAIDLEGVTNALANKKTDIGIGAARSITAVEAGNKTRVVLSLLSTVDFSLDSQGKDIVLKIDAGAGATAMAGITKTEARGISAGTAGSGVTGIDFKRGDKGKAEIILQMSQDNAVVDMRTEGSKLVLDVIDTELQADLARRLDVTDFATPVKTIETSQKGNNVHMVIEAEGDYEHMAYQLDDSYVLEVRPLTKEEVEEIRLQKKTFTGDRLSLNFQSIEVRSVLQLLADFTGLNIVVSDSVGGSVTLRLMNVPWDQAMDIILKTKGLAMRQNDNVVLVAPASEIDAWETQELEAIQKKEDLAPLRTELIEINYATADDIAGILEQDRGSDDEDKSSLLSARGTVTVDQRTNSILIKDTAQKIDEVHKLIAKLDVPVKQVMIESRIVIASNEFSRELGLKWNAYDANAANRANPGSSLGGESPTGVTEGSNSTDLLMNGFVSAGIAGIATGGLNVVLAKVGSTIIDLELAAMQQEKKGEVLSNPRVLTANNESATISDGTKVRADTADEGGNTQVTYTDATLSLTVTPQITPDDKIIMELDVSDDAKDGDDISTKSIQTKVVVDNGDTVILGGVYRQTDAVTNDKVPFFGDLPGVGVLFKNDLVDRKSNELLIFVTPKIVKDSVTRN